LVAPSEALPSFERAAPSKECHSAFAAGVIPQAYSHFELALEAQLVQARRSDRVTPAQKLWC
jgi:hypothetical protein